MEILKEHRSLKNNKIEAVHSGNNFGVCLTNKNKMIIYGSIYNSKETLSGIFENNPS